MKGKEGEFLQQQKNNETRIYSLADIIQMGW